MEYGQFAIDSHAQPHAEYVWNMPVVDQYGYFPQMVAPTAGHGAPTMPIPPSVECAFYRSNSDEHTYFVPPTEQSEMYTNDDEADYKHCTSPTVEVNVDELLEYQRRRSSASNEDKEPLTPAQRRRKAQNRVAQRAFRDRKRQRVQHLEAQLSELETQTKSLATDNQNLKQQLALTQTENEVLRSIAQSNATRTVNVLRGGHHVPIQ